MGRLFVLLQRNLAFTFYLMLFIFSRRTFSCTENGTIKSLEPGKVAFNEVLYDKQTALFLLEKLVANATYEVRVSYPAVVPTDFTIRVLTPSQEPSFKSRHLLNIEKTIFTTNDATKGYVVEVTAHRVGFPSDPERLKDPVTYNIVVERLYFGLSTKSWQMVCYAVVICLVTFKYLVPMAHRYILSATDKDEHQS